MSDQLPQLESPTGDASIEELMKAAEEEAKQAAAESNGEVSPDNVEVSNELPPENEEDFYSEFMEYFNASSDEIVLHDVNDVQITLKIQRLGIFHLRTYQKKITAVAKKISEGELPCDVTRDENGNILKMKVLWSKAWPLITDIIVEDLLELIQDAITIKNEDGKFKKLTDDEFNNICISDFPLIVVPFIHKNFADPKSRAPWQRMVKGLLGKFGIGRVNS